jgi:hypothetical protein
VATQFEYRCVATVVAAVQTVDGGARGSHPQD